MNPNLNPSPPGWMRNAEDLGGGGGCPLPPLSGPRVGLALSGGGARGLAHIGVLQVLEENDIPIAAIAGTSMGAYVGALYAAGFKSEDLQSLAQEIKDRRTLLRLLDPVFPPSSGLIRGNKIRRHLERSLGNRTFDDLNIPLLIVATDLDTLSPYVFDSGPLGAAVQASAAIPGICAPVHLNGRRFTDGGAAEPLPASLLQGRFALDSIIAVNVLPTTQDILHCRDAAFGAPPESNSFWKHPLRALLKPINLLAYGNVMDTFRRGLMAAQLGLAEKECRRADVVIHPFFCESTWFDFENFDRYITAGRRAAEEALPRIRALLDKVNSNQNPDHENSIDNPCLGLCAA
ncbi:NTE family protein [Prosthecobacter debontii]|uniref:NTE family protein n=1 Tax=Prosthecobacter debontii TaxID=48467 RepID=A0A1T4YQ92_9BACT|nr:patatin-like phospholipase family protein [Prosthecobacter debontii]SKB03441.1 NTE family protein [Prosthecobacter debontii]